MQLTDFHVTKTCKSETLQIAKWKAIKSCFFLSHLPLFLLQIIPVIYWTLWKKYAFVPYLFGYLPQMSFFLGLMTIDFYKWPLTLYAISQHHINIQDVALEIRGFKDI